VTAPGNWGAFGPEARGALPLFACAGAVQDNWETPSSPRVAATHEALQAGQACSAMRERYPPVLLLLGGWRETQRR